MCRLHRWLFRLLPLRSWRGRLLGGPVRRCPRCAAAPSRLEEARLRAFLEPDWIVRAPSLWPELERRIETGAPQAAAPTVAGRRPAARQAFRWLAAAAAAGAAVLILTATGVLPPWSGRPAADAPGPVQASLPAEEARPIVIDSQTLQGKPARAYCYQTPRASYVWIAPVRGNGV